MNRAWVDCNIAELQDRHGGKVILVVDQRVEAVADSVEELWERARGREDALVMRVPVGEIQKPM